MPIQFFAMLQLRAQKFQGLVCRKEDPNQRTTMKIQIDRDTHGNDENIQIDRDSHGNDENIPIYTATWHIILSQFTHFYSLQSIPSTIQFFTSTKNFISNLPSKYLPL